jgi:GntR family transcriptional repressor for pyruvate dehydrogenase complex
VWPPAAELGTAFSADASKLYQQVASTLAQSIRDGKYVPGERLPSERDLADALSVSRPTVREAMIALEVWGVVEARQRSGNFVVDVLEIESAEPPALEEVSAIELVEARRLIESESCALAAGAISQDEVDGLAAIMEDMIQDLGHDVRSEVAEHRFHLAVARATRNGVIVAMVKNLWDQRQGSQDCRTQFARSRQLDAQRLIDDHQEILHAIQARDPGQARAAMTQHLGRLMDRLLAFAEIEALEQAKRKIAARRRELARRANL